MLTNSHTCCGVVYSTFLSKCAGHLNSRTNQSGFILLSLRLSSSYVTNLFKRFCGPKIWQPLGPNTIGIGTSVCKPEKDGISERMIRIFDYFKNNEEKGQFHLHEWSRLLDDSLCDSTIKNKLKEHFGDHVLYCISRSYNCCRPPQPIVSKEMVKELHCHLLRIQDLSILRPSRAGTQW